MSYYPEQNPPQGDDRWNAPGVPQPPPDGYQGSEGIQYSIEPDPHGSHGAVEPYANRPDSGQPYGNSPLSHPGAYASYAPPAGYYGAPAYGPPGYGVPPGQWSDKSKMTAGLLQLLPAIFFGFGGIGRLYAGQIALGVTQIAITLVGWTAFWCGFLLIFPFFIEFAIWVWFVVDGIVLLAGASRDGEGRLLR